MSTQKKTKDQTAKIDVQGIVTKSKRKHDITYFSLRKLNVHTNYEMN